MINNHILYSSIFWQIVQNFLFRWQVYHRALHRKRFRFFFSFTCQEASCMKCVCTATFLSCWHKRKKENVMKQQRGKKNRIPIMKYFGCKLNFKNSEYSVRWLLAIYHINHSFVLFPFFFFAPTIFSCVFVILFFLRLTRAHAILPVYKMVLY